jgi:hypothetical protein
MCAAIGGLIAAAAACRRKITRLANDVLKMVQETDALIDDLPGLDKTEVYVLPWCVGLTWC